MQLIYLVVETDSENGANHVSSLLFYMRDTMRACVKSTEITRAKIKERRR